MGTSQSFELPKTMRRLVLTKASPDLADAELQVEEVPMPVPAAGEVLIRVIAAPVNPSDYGEWSHVVPSSGDTPQKKPIGKEGSGIVVAAGRGVYGNLCVGSKVGFVTNVKGQGAYAEYTTVNALQGVFPLPDSVPCEDAASHFVNPYTAYGFIDTVNERNKPVAGKRPGLVHTAAASQLGQMLVKLCKQEDITLINVVRRQEQANTLRALGATHVVVTSEPGWEGTLAALVKEYSVQFAFDAVAGGLSGVLLDCLPYGGTLFVYGRLSNEGCSGIQPLDLIYRKKKLEGFFLTSWVTQGNGFDVMMRIRAATAKVHAGLANGWSSSQFVDCSIDDMWDTFCDMYKNSGFTNRKLRIRFP